MGMFDGITSAASGIAGSVLGFVGQQQTNQKSWDIAQSANAASAQQAQQQMDFQERMRATQYQTAMEDMKKAGLNPMLAASQGGAGTPSGAMGQVSTANFKSPISAGVASGLQSSAVAADTNLKSEQATQTVANTTLTEQQAKKTDAETASIILAMPNISQKFKNEVATELLLREQTEQASAQSVLNRANAVLSHANARNVQQSTNLRSPDEDVAKTAYGKIRPYASDAGKVINSATKALKPF
jgi:hypothetical protein